MFKQYKLRNYKFILVMYVVILNVIGILLIGSAKPSVQSKQIFGMIAGLTIMVMLSLIEVFLADLLFYGRCAFARYVCR